MDVENFQKRLDTLPTKPTKPGYVSFVSTPPGHIQKNSSWLERLKAVKEEAPPVPMKEITRLDLEAIHPAIVHGIPLSVILDHADPSDYPDLADRDILEAFARSLIATRTLDPSQYRETPQDSARPVLVRCSECIHHIPSETSPKHGIGRCEVDSPTRLRPAPWPGSPRRCGEFKREDAQ